MEKEEINTGFGLPRIYAEGKRQKNQMTRKEAHEIFEECLKQGEMTQLTGQISFVTNWQNGQLKDIVDEGWKRKWRKLTSPPIAPLTR